MAYQADQGERGAVFDGEFRLLDTLAARGNNPPRAGRESDPQDTEIGHGEAGVTAAELTAELDQTAGERDAALRQVSKANARAGELHDTINGLRFELGQAARARDVLRVALERVVAAVMDGAADPLPGALDALESTGGVLPAVSAWSRWAVAA